MFSKCIVVICVACVALCGCAAQPVAPAATSAPAPSAIAPAPPAPAPIATVPPQATQPAPPATAPATASPATDAPADEVTPEPTSERAIWGTEVTLDEFIAMALSGRVGVIEWFVPYDRIRITERTGPRYNYKNTTKLDMVKVLEEAGVVIGDEGIPLTYET